MQLITMIGELRARLRDERGIAFVPTMGNLHQGHLDLVRLAREAVTHERGGCVVVSIFVNPLQFGANEDLSDYPRTLAEDYKLLEQCGVDVVFAPGEDELYPQPQEVTVEPPRANELCGAFRPGHFRGVATVVLKLLNIVQPQVAVFGKKDYQQLYVIRQLVAQLNLPIQIVGGETGRASDGLALSSRNQYLSATERVKAATLHQTLQSIAQALRTGARDFVALERRAAEALAAQGWQVEYVAVRAQPDLGPPTADAETWVVLAAARLGRTRLIDNVEVCI